EEYVAGRLRDETLGTERIPSAERSAADPQAIAVESEDRDRARLRSIAGEDERLFEPIAVAGESSGDAHAGRQPFDEALHQLAPVDREAVGDHDRMHEPFTVDRARELNAGGEAVASLGDRDARGQNTRALERDRGGDEGLIGDFGSEDLTRR